MGNQELRGYNPPLNEKESVCQMEGIRQMTDLELYIQNKDRVTPYVERGYNELAQIEKPFEIVPMQVVRPLATLVVVGGVGAIALTGVVAVANGLYIAVTGFFVANSTVIGGGVLVVLAAVLFMSGLGGNGGSAKKEGQTVHNHFYNNYQNCQGPNSGSNSQGSV